MTGSAPRPGSGSGQALWTRPWPTPPPGPEEVLLQKERLETLSRLLSAMSAGDRALFYRKYYYLQSTQQMAAELGTTARAVEGRLYRIRKKLQKQMGGELA